MEDDSGTQWPQTNTNTHNTTNITTNHLKTLQTDQLSTHTQHKIRWTTQNPCCSWLQKCSRIYPSNRFKTRFLMCTYVSGMISRGHGVRMSALFPFGVYAMYYCIVSVWCLCHILSLQFLSIVYVRESACVCLLCECVWLVCLVWLVYE